MRDAGVQTDARDVEEQASLYFAGINRSLAAAERQLECCRCIEWDPEFTREAIAGSTWNECKRRIGERDRRSNLVHRAVAPPGQSSKYRERRPRAQAPGR